MHLPCFHERYMWSNVFFLSEKHVSHMMHWLAGQRSDIHVRWLWFGSLLIRWCISRALFEENCRPHLVPASSMCR